MSGKSKKPVSHSNPESPAEARLLTVKSAAQYLSTTIWCVRNLAWSRSVPHIRLGARILFDRADLDRYIESQKVKAA
jgi:excisionase family DNA binding protein